jgi:DNA-binding transcriptional ArsR family regulator
MKERKVIKDPGAFQLLANETRMKMIYLLRAKEMTVSQIAADLGLTPQTIYHHIRKLRKFDMVEVSREERTDHIVESHYKATAGMFYFTAGGCKDELSSAERIETILDALGGLGFGVRANSKQISSIVKITERLHGARSETDIAHKIVEMDDIDSTTQEYLTEMAMLISMDDGKFQKYLDVQQSLRKLLLSLRTEDK